MSFLFKNKTLAITALVLCGFIAFGATLGAGLWELDDQYLIVSQAQKDAGTLNAGAIFSRSLFGQHAYYRPLAAYIDAATVRFVGVRPFAVRFVRLTLHIITSIVLYMLIGSLLKEKTHAFFAALIFVMHPLQWDTLITSLPDLLCGLGYALTILCFHRALTSRPGGIVWYGLSLFFYAAALCSKEFAITVPLTLFAYQYFFHREKRLHVKILEIVPYGMILSGYLFIRYALGITAVFVAHSFMIHIKSILVFLQSLCTYVCLSVVPHQLRMQRMGYIGGSSFELSLIAALLVFVCFISVIVRYRHYIPRSLAFFLVWSGIAVLPVSQIVPLSPQPGYIYIAEHFMYIPLMGFVTVLVVMASRFFHARRVKRLVSKTYLRIGLYGWILFLLLTSMQLSIYATNEIVLYERNLALEPYNAPIRMSLATAYAYRGEFDEAEHHYKVLLSYYPHDIMAQAGLAQSLFFQKKYAEALPLYREVVPKMNHPQIKRTLLEHVHIMVEYFRFDVTQSTLEKP